MANICHKIGEEVYSTTLEEMLRFLKGLQKALWVVARCLIKLIKIGEKRIIATHRNCTRYLMLVCTLR